MGCYSRSVWTHHPIALVTTRLSSDDETGSQIHQESGGPHRTAASMSLGLRK